MYLHASSQHFPPQKTRVINTLVTRASIILDLENLGKEIKHLSQVFKENGYENK